MAKFIIWIVEDSGELTKTWLKYAAKKCFKMIGMKAVGLRLCTKVNKG